MMGMGRSKGVVAARPGEDTVDKQDIEGKIAEGREEACSEAALRRITGEEDLTGVRNLVLTVDTNESQVDHLGTLMPLLSELRLERGSTLASFRDLGSSLSNLRVVWLSACGIRHLDGVGALSGLEELYLAFNDVEDLTSIALHERLEVLDLESNSVRDAEQAIQLGTCPRLWSLTLTANPVCRGRHYRRVVVEAVPQLASLDEEDVTENDRRPPPTPAEEEEEEEEEGDGGRPLLSPEQAALPPHRHTPRPSPSETFCPASAKRPSPNEFLRGSAGAGNRNLREFEMLGACSSQDEDPRSESVLAAWSIRGTPEVEGHPATAVAHRTTELSASSGTRPKAQLGGRCCGHVGDAGTSGREATADAEGLDKVAKSAPDRTRGGQKDEAGDRLGGQEAPSDGESAGNRRGTVSRSWKLDPCRGFPPPAGEASSAFVDEEEMVARAIKNFRLLASAACANKKEPMTSPRRHVGALDVARPISGCVCGNARACEGCAAVAGNAAKGARWTGGGEKNSSPLRKNGRMNDIAISRCPLEASRDRSEERGSGNGEKCRGSSETRDAWEGSDWILEVLRLQDMGPNAGIGLSLTVAEGRSDATSALTHGSEMSIAGNPAFGLRRRRAVDQTFRPNDSTFASKPTEDEPRHEAKTRIGDGAVHPRPAVGVTCPRQGAGGEEADTARRRLVRRGSGTRPDVDTHGKVETYPGGEDGKEEDLEALSVAADGGGAGGAGDTGTNTFLASANHHRAPAAVGASLSCRALVSPPSLPQRCLYYVRGRPATAEDTCTTRGAESFARGGEESTCCSPPSAAAVKAAAGIGGSGFCRRGGVRLGMETGEGRRALQSMSAADILTVGVGDCGGPGNPAREGRLANGVCGSEDLEGSRNNGRNNRRCLREIDVFDDGGQSQGGKFEGSVQPSEVPEWSPTSNARNDVCEGGSDCPGGWDGGFRFVNDSGGGDDGGGDCGGGGCHGSAGGGRGYQAPPIIGGSSRNAREIYPGMNGCQKTPENREAEHAVLRKRQHSKNEAAVPGIADPTERRHTSGGDERGGALVGPGTAESDERLVALLRKRPKNVPQIRTREAFRSFFRGMERERLRRLLREAYADRGAVECDAKVKKRLVLLETSLDASL